MFLRSSKRNQQGMTLVEVLVAMAVLAIIVSAFLLLSSTSITGIFNAGAKSKAITASNEKSDQLYAIVTNAATQAAAKTALESAPGYAVSYDSISYVADYAPRFCFNQTPMIVDGTAIEGFRITVVVFYSQGKFKVELESFVLKSSSTG